MMTRNEVIKALECCVLRDPDDRPRCGDCPYPSGSACSNRLKIDALALLKEKPKRGRWLRDPFRARHWYCSECGNVISVPPEAYKYCPECGMRNTEE